MISPPTGRRIAGHLRAQFSVALTAVESSGRSRWFKGVGDDSVLPGMPLDPRRFYSKGLCKVGDAALGQTQVPFGVLDRGHADQAA